MLMFDVLSLGMSCIASPYSCLKFCIFFNEQKKNTNKKIVALHNAGNNEIVRLTETYILM